jgi:carboxypeptidase family protein
MTRFWRFTLLAPALFVLTLPTFSQTLGTVTSEVRDATGAVIPDVQLTVRNMQTNVSRPVATNESGVYTVPALNPGIYEVRATKSGFQSATRSNIELRFSGAIGAGLRIARFAWVTS